MIKIYNTAAKYIGLDERKDNKRLKKLLSINAATAVDPSRIAWCSSFICAILAKNGIEGTDKLTARSYLKWGAPVNENAVEKGDLVVLKRGTSSWQGHIGIFDGWSGWRRQKVRLLGGNQSNKVCIRSYSVSSILGIRRHK